MPADVRAVGLDAGQIGLEDEQVDQLRQLRILGVLREQLLIRLGRRPAVEILVRDGDQTLVEQRIALTRHLDESPEAARSLPASSPRIRTCSRLVVRVDADHLLIAADLAERDRQRHQVNVEAALGVLARGAKRQQIEDRLDVGVEAVVTLTGERGVAAIRAAIDCSCSDRARPRWRRRPGRGSRRCRPGCRTAWHSPGCSAGRCRSRGRGAGAVR